MSFVTDAVYKKKSFLTQVSKTIRPFLSEFYLILYSPYDISAFSKHERCFGTN